MCGIAGFTHSNGRRQLERIWEITRSLIHRGPDRQDVWVSSNVSLGAVRLKIIDLEHGDQPMVSDDGDTVLVFNGEIYNHAELRRELEALGHRFDSRCDTEVVLRAFLEWDVRSFAKLRGMFGAALWNESRQRLILVRDRVGIKPLYFRRHGDDLYFGSEMKAILLHPELDRRITCGHWNDIFPAITFRERTRWSKISRNWLRETGSNGGTARCQFILTGACSSSQTRGWILPRQKRNSTGCCVPP